MADTSMLWLGMEPPELAWVARTIRNQRVGKYYSRDFTVSFYSCLTSSRPGLVCGYAK